nr:MAG TPA: hypothetical protein [Caudoviricetes sp.]
MRFARFAGLLGEQLQLLFEDFFHFGVFHHFPRLLFVFAVDLFSNLA